ncbi:MAG: PmoA family protein [Planctomycetes bacterium]|nr:PmoA family protein [Planctomycetota bacterium]
MSLRALLFFVALSCVFVRGAAADEPPPLRPQPIPRLQALPGVDYDTFLRDGVELARYWRRADLKRPFVYPIIGPSGRALTRMGHPHDPVTHSHHNSVWVAHHDVNGIDFWGDTTKSGRIVPQRIERYDDGDEAASLTAVNAWIAPDGKTFLTERRRLTVEPLEDNQWRLLIDLEFSAPQSPATFGKTSFGPVAVRMAKSLGVRDGGGQIRNSNGDVNEKQVFWKPARWCDYSGAVADGVIEGITLMDHPTNVNHPTKYHVRDDGWMGTGVSFDGPVTIEPGTPLRLRYGLFVHRGLPSVEALDAEWKKFADTTPPVSLAPEKKK